MVAVIIEVWPQSQWVLQLAIQHIGLPLPCPVIFLEPQIVYSKPQPTLDPTVLHSQEVLKYPT
jgi:hypothetical protein